MSTDLNIVKVTKPQEKSEHFIHKNSNICNETVQPHTEEEQATENIPESHTRDANKQAASRGRLNFKTVDHVGAYPLIQETEEIANKVAITRIILSQTKPRIQKVIISRPVQTVAPVINFFDKVANSTLNTMERVVPSLKTKTYQRLGEEIALPYTCLLYTSRCV